MAREPDSPRPTLPRPGGLARIGQRQLDDGPLSPTCESVTHRTAPTSRLERSALRRVTFALGSALLLATSCTSPASPPSTAVGPTIPVTATVAGTTSLAAVSTAPRDVATTAAPVRPTTTVAVSDQVRAAAQAFVPYYVGCLRQPATCDVARFTAEGSDARAAATKTIADLVRGGFFVGDEDPGVVVIDSIEVRADHVLVTTCEWSTMILYGPPATPGGPPLVQNDTHGTTYIDRQWVLDGGAWRIRRSDTTATAVGGNECSPKS